MAAFSRTCSTKAGRIDHQRVQLVLGGRLELERMVSDLLRQPSGLIITGLTRAGSSSQCVSLQPGEQLRLVLAGLCAWSCRSSRLSRWLQHASAASRSVRSVLQRFGRQRSGS